MRFFISILALLVCTTIYAQDLACLGQGSDDFYIQNLAQKEKEVRDIDNAISSYQRKIIEDKEKIYNLQVPLQKAKDAYTSQKRKNDSVRRKLIDAYEDSGNDKKPMDRVMLNFNEQEARLLTAISNIQDAINDLNSNIAEQNKKIEIEKQSRNKNKFIASWIDEKPKGEAQLCSDCALGLLSRLAPINQLSNWAKTFVQGHIKADCISKSLANKSLSNTEVQCDNAKSEGSSRPKSSNICINKNLSDYIQWSFNKAIDCLGGMQIPGTENHKIDPNILELKVNNESAFRFFFSYGGGHGIMQTITCSEEEMLGRSPSRSCSPNAGPELGRSTGRKFLAKLMSEPGHRCDMYKDIFNYDKEHEMDLQTERIKTLKNISKGGSSDAVELIKFYTSQLNSLQKIYPDLTKAKKLVEFTQNKQIGTPLDQKNMDKVNIAVTQQIEEMKKQNIDKRQVSDKIDSIKKTLRALKDPKHIDAAGKADLDNMEKQENASLANRESSYPLYNKKLFNPNQKNNCQFISLEEGIHRNILTGLGLFLYYRDGWSNGDSDGSAKDILAKMGISSKNCTDYRDKLNYTALAMYGSDGDGGAFTKIMAHKPDFYYKDKTGKTVTPETMSKDQFFKILRKVMKPSNDPKDPGYIGSIENSKNDVFKNGEGVQCSEH